MPNRVHRLALVIGFALVLTFTEARPAAAGCSEKERYTNAALVSAAHIDVTSRFETRSSYMKSGYISLEKAQAERCANPTASAQWELADSWLGAYEALDVVRESQGPVMSTCRSLHVAEARAGLALSWLELERAQEQLGRTATFKRALDALEMSSLELAVKLPSLRGDRAAADAYIRSSVQAAESASKTSCTEPCTASRP